MIEGINEQNFLLFATKHYDNPQCFDDTEFFEDLKRVKYIKRLLRKYKETGEMKERLVLNHIIVLNNVFGPYATSHILFLKLEGFESVLKPFFEYINIMPEKTDPIGYKQRIIRRADIKGDDKIYTNLKKI